MGAQRKSTQEQRVPQRLTQALGPGRCRSWCWRRGLAGQRGSTGWPVRLEARGAARRARPPASWTASYQSVAQAVQFVLDRMRAAFSDAPFDWPRGLALTTLAMTVITHDPRDRFFGKD